MIGCFSHDLYACDIKTHRKRQKQWAEGVDKALAKLGAKHKKFSLFCEDCPAAIRHSEHNKEVEENYRKKKRKLDKEYGKGG